MLRRNFVKAGLVSLGSLFGINFLKADETPFESEFGLGRYVRHTLEEVFYEPGHWTEYEYEQGYRFVNFPVETKLTIYYERGYETHFAFNITKQEFAEFANFNEYQLKSKRVNSFADWKDKYSTSFEVRKDKDGQPYGFRLQMVSLTENARKSNELVCRI